MKETSLRDMRANKPEQVIELAVKGMLPKNRLGAQLLRNLHVYVGTEHKHEAQSPKALDINTLK